MAGQNGESGTPVHLHSEHHWHELPPYVTLSDPAFQHALGRLEGSREPGEERRVRPSLRADTENSRQRSSTVISGWMWPWSFPLTRQSRHPLLMQNPSSPSVHTDARSREPVVGQAVSGRSSPRRSNDRPANGHLRSRQQPDARSGTTLAGSVDCGEIIEGSARPSRASRGDRQRLVDILGTRA